ncbi:hypothetical protein ACETWN_04820 [Aeromonas hydrophila]|uniref:hypothetical protein n=1 Tax=Aeromonas hydrophila TaxID=644 RepID=UPI0035A3AD24
MINIKPKWKTSIEDVFTIINSKNISDRQLLNSISGELTYRMMQYVIYRKNLHWLHRSSYSKQESDALELCYDSNTDALSSLKKSIIENISSQNDYLLQKCPYCLVRNPDTWDHYMPKSKYPEFSVFSGNLLRVCGTCNIKKSNGLVEGKKETIHTYFDILPNEELLKCEIKVSRSGVPIINFFIQNPKKLDIVNSVINHFNAFELNDLYKSESSSFISVRLQELANNYTNGISKETFIDEIRNRYNAIPLHWGYNNWEAAVLKGMSNCVELVDIINGLPKNTGNDWERK